MLLVLEIAIINIIHTLSVITARSKDTCGSVFSFTDSEFRTCGKGAAAHPTGSTRDRICRARDLSLRGTINRGAASSYPGPHKLGRAASECPALGAEKVRRAQNKGAGARACAHTSATVSIRFH